MEIPNHLLNSSVSTGYSKTRPFLFQYHLSIVCHPKLPFFKYCFSIKNYYFFSSLNALHWLMPHAFVGSLLGWPLFPLAQRVNFDQSPKIQSKDLLLCSSIPKDANNQSPVILILAIFVKLNTQISILFCLINHFIAHSTKFNTIFISNLIRFSRMSHDIENLRNI